MNHKVPKVEPKAAPRVELSFKLGDRVRPKDYGSLWSKPWFTLIVGEISPCRAPGDLDRLTIRLSVRDGNRQPFVVGQFADEYEPYPL